MSTQTTPDRMDGLSPSFPGLDITSSNLWGTDTPPPDTLHPPITLYTF
ncbi:uncharacterized protein G2W53_008166 [Senna tora]|uniref:Uncharacterized protein n=1 Tax=Senna tora TaxID=362788 RepID=A0A835CEY9_9FABA|nr:uncharacterized protein G2W53_008166 [Senna tora]